MIAMTSFLKSDKSTRGVALVSAEQVAGRRGAGRSRHNYNLVKTKTHFVSNFDQSSGCCCDPLIGPRYFVSRAQNTSQLISQDHCNIDQAGRKIERVKTVAVHTKECHIKYFLLRLEYFLQWVGGGIVINVGCWLAGAERRLQAQARCLANDAALALARLRAAVTSRRTATINCFSLS